MACQQAKKNVYLEEKVWKYQKTQAAKKIYLATETKTKEEKEHYKKKIKHV